MNYTFLYSQFVGDLSNWNVSKVKNMTKVFDNSDIVEPWWYIKNYDLRQQTIKKYNLMNTLNEKLTTNKTT